MTRIGSNKRFTTIAAAMAAVVAVLGGVAVAASGESGGSGKRPLLITAEVERRTLTDDVTIKGTLGRVEQRQVDATAPGRVSAVHVDDGVIVEAGQPILSLDGRDAVAVPGDFPFFRDLAVGSQGNDVRQLEQVLSAAGYRPGAVDSTFTEETRGALARWQDAHGYPGSAPELDETVTVALGQGSGYTLGDESSAAVVIGTPTGKAATVKAAAAGTPVVKQAFVDDGYPHLTIQSLDDQVAEGAPARFRISSNKKMENTQEISFSVGGTAGSDDYVAPLDTIELRNETWSSDFEITIRQDDDVEPDEDLLVSLVDDNSNVRVSTVPARVTIVSDDVPELRLTGGGAVTEGVRSIVTISADQAPIHDLQVALSFAGDAVAGDDYVARDPIAILPAGLHSVDVPIVTLSDSTLEDDERVVVGLVAGSSQYTVGRTSTAIITINKAVGSAALPTITLRTTSTHVAEGQPVPITLSMTRALTDDLAFVLGYAGSASLGNDYAPVPGRLVVPAGQTSLQLSVPTIQDDVVEADRTLVVSLAPSALYRVGDPSTGTTLIESDDVPELSLEGGVGQIAEGVTDSFTIVADQAPIEDIVVSYQVLGSATPGQDFAALTGIAVLPAGVKSLSVSIRTLSDDVVFHATDMVVGHWPIRIGQVLVDEGESVLAGAPLLSLTDTGLTVTLHAGASDRTKLQPGQKATVKLAGSTDQVEGTIEKIDETASVDEATGEQFYEGTIQIGDLPGADGATVTIEVVLDQRPDAITVPIAAVKQDGSGKDVVRVIDLEKSGAITEVPVTTGIAEGSYIEVREGLKGGEVVVVEIEAPA
jgi:multidrug efflux pump subunit AcrA (membrane-fusion protein)/peptidoglycan hydrolase-like protein with peptidoglycan-binding domain